MILSILLVLVCLIVNVLILMQEGKSAGLTSSIGGGSSDTYWSKNKGRSLEGKLERFTKYFAILIIVIAIVLNMGFFK